MSVCACASISDKILPRLGAAGSGRKYNSGAVRKRFATGP
jgi:hypothetical protein